MVIPRNIIITNRIIINMISDKKSVIIIPSLEPGDELIPYVNELIANGFNRIIVINDGSNSSYNEIFSTLATKPECIMLTHAINLGKGRALKNAFNCFLNMPDKDEFYGVITADSDGQHSVEDVIKLNEELATGTEELILGVRDFDSDNVPPKSKFGNKITRQVFKLFHNVKITDTQTGLRGIPSSLVAIYIDLPGERFEYETNMLVQTAVKGVPFKEIPIKTIYLNENSGTHFNPIKDSIAIYKLLFSTFIKFSLSSMSSFLVDIAIFQFLIMLMAGFDTSIRIGVSTLVARIFSSLYNFYINKRVVFGSNANSKSTLIKYYTLVVCQMALSALLVWTINTYILLPETIAKIIVDTILFFLSYRIQKQLIFRN